MNESLTNSEALTNSVTAYELARSSQLPYWSQWALLLAVVAVIFAFSWWWSRRDTHALRPLSRWVLFGLRAAALCGLLLFFFNLEKKTQREVRENSRVAVLVDTSQSMGLPASLNAAGSADPESRAERVVELFASSPLLEQLQEHHDVRVLGFDDAAAPRNLAHFPRKQTESDTQPDEQDNQFNAKWREMTWITWGGVTGLVLGFILLIIAGMWAESAAGSFLNLVSAVLLLGSVIGLSVGDLRNDDIRPWDILRGAPRPTEIEEPSEPEDVSPAEQEQLETVDWAAAVRPRGIETRLGDAIVQVVNQERGGPFAGIILISDGVNNQGTTVAEAARLARQAAARIVTIGLGSDRQPQSVRVIDVEAPAKAYPGDKFQIRGYIQAFGMPGEFVSLQVASGTLDETGEFRESAIEPGSKRLQLGGDGEVIPVDFDIRSDEIGVQVYQLQIVGASEADLDQSDNRKSVKVQIVQQRNCVMLLAGGPTREFRFLRNQLFRDKDVELHVLLQSGQPGLSQESDVLLSEFPDDPQVLFEQYDCIVAFDPDWSQLSLAQVELLERWVGEKAGGLIVVAGPIFTPQWASVRQGDEAIDIIKDLHPVNFFSRGTSIGLGRFGSEVPRRVILSTEGLKSEALLLDDSPEVSEKLWQQFDGVYGYFTVRGLKPGATSWAAVDAATTGRGNMPVYMASHFYGAGRVAFLGSGEMWRLRSMGVGNFESFYTRLIRFASQGRLARDSNRGLLLLSADRVSLGETVEVRAFLTDPQHRPLTDPEISARLITPDGTGQSLVLRQLPDFEEGQFAGQFVPLQAGDYRVEVELPAGGAPEVLAQEVRVRIPDLEIANPRRDDAALNQLAGETGGTSFVGVADFLDTSRTEPVIGLDLLPPRDMFTALPDLVDRGFQLHLRFWLLTFIVLALAVEWVQRRFAKLA